MQDDAAEGKLPVLRLTSVANRFAKAEVAADGNAAHSNAAEPEDEFRAFYMNASNSNVVLQPPYNIRLLDRLAQENNALSPCIEAMVTNIEGTGFDFENKSDEAAAEDDSKIEALRDFFAQPWPGESFVNMRKLLRRDLERMGNAYIEVIRDPKDQIQFIRRVDAKMMRMVVLDEAVPVPKTVRRAGKDVTITVNIRERRFVQLLHGTALVYFKEFGASRDLDKKMGQWSEKGQRLPAPQRATEIIHLKVLPDAHTPYGVPRWISQLPSVLGSRKAEEFNLDFFDNGGVPPVLILLQGGTLQPELKAALDLKMGIGSASSKNRVQVLEVMPSGGTFNSPNQVRVTVERFGSERQDDSMFENYDEKCETRVRRSFRLPPIFVGQAQDYSFATAVASYAVAEAQVFAPERGDFDEAISISLLPALGFNDYKMVSKPLVIQDAAVKLQGIQLAQGTGNVDPEDTIYEINEAAGTSLKFKAKEEGDPAVIADAMQLTALDRSQQGATPSEDPATGGSAQRAAPNGTGYTKADASAVMALRTVASLRKRDIEGLDAYVQLSKEFDAAAKRSFLSSLALAHFPEAGPDIEGLGGLAEATLAVIAQNGGACGCGGHGTN